MNKLLEGKSARKLIVGIKVERPSSLLPQAADVVANVLPIFNIIGGRVAITQIIGEVTVVIAGGACNTSLEGNPAVGTMVPICAVLATTVDEAGCLYGITGLNTDALIGINAGALPGQERDVILSVGALDWRTSADNTGEVKWTVFYVPVDDGAYMTPA